MVRRLAAAALAVTLIAAQQPAPPPTEQEQIQTTVDKFVADFNQGYFKAVIDACAPTAAIVDGFPPYAWNSCFDWMNAYQANNRALSATHGTLAIYSEVSGDRAYIIYPATFSDTQQGKPVTYKGSWTMTLRKMLDGWTFTGSASAWGDNTLNGAAVR